MIQKENIQNALCAGANSPAVMQSFTSSVTPAIGFFDIVNPALIYRVRIKNSGTRQSILFPVSAGNEPRISTMRPNPYLSIGI